MHHLWLSLSLPLAVCLHQTHFLEALKVISNPDTFDYHIVNNNRTNDVLFQGGDIAIFVAGKWCVHKTSTMPMGSALMITDDDDDDSNYRKLVPQSREAIHGTDATLGSYSGETVHWLCTNVIDGGGNIPIVTSYRNMDSGAAVIFDVIWPDGAPNTTVVGSHTSSLANYPSLRVSQQHLPNALSWEGSFSQSVRGFSEGTPGGPTIFYNGREGDEKDGAFESAIIGSPWNGNWKASSAGNNQNWAGDADYWSPGTSGRIEMLPKGYKQSILLYQRNDGHQGITATMESWGRIMQKSRKPATGPFKVPDITLEKIGYQTDNGAMYCFCKDKNCSQTLLAEIEYLKNEGVPMGYLSFQGAGASSGRGEAAPWCIDTWGVDGGLGKQYSMDLESFQRALGLPLQLYAPYFCPGSHYFDSDEHSSQWKSISSDTNLPGCNAYAFENVQPSQSRAFYDWFLNKGVEINMASFETDFMNQNHNCVPDFIHHATAAETWQQGMASAALAKNIPIQWCYASPTDVLASLDMPALTNFRVSFDFCYGKSYRIGESSLLVWALGGAPSKDTLWSTDNDRTAIPGCPWTPDHEEQAAELHVVLALMSKGPVGISDSIGYTNATLLKRIIRQDGTLLKPLKSITAVDSTFLDSSHPILASLADSSPEDEGGYVYGTAGLGPSWYFVSFLLPQSYTIKLRDLWPSLPTIPGRRNTIAYRRFDSGLGCKKDRNAVLSGCVKLLELSSTVGLSQGVFKVPAAPLSTSKQSRYIPTVTSVWQACPQSRWILLGELDKYVPLSPERFQKVECTDEAISITIIGTAGEEVEVFALRPGDEPGNLKYYVVRRRVKISRQKTASVNFAPPIQQDAIE